MPTEPDTEGRFVTVSLTSLRGSKDQTVILFANEHSSIKHDTCVLYSAAEFTDGETITARIRQGDARLRQPLSPTALELVLDGFVASDFTKERIYDFVKAYRAARRSRSGR